MLDALRQCEPEMPTLLGGGDGFTNANVTMDFFTQSAALGMHQQGTMSAMASANSGSNVVEDGISSTSSPTSSVSTLSSTLKAGTMVVHTLAELYDRELVNTIGWAKQIPGIYKIKTEIYVFFVLYSFSKYLKLDLLQKHLKIIFFYAFINVYIYFF